MENTNEKSIGQQLQEELTWKFPAVAMAEQNTSTDFIAIFL